MTPFAEPELGPTPDLVIGLDLVVAVTGPSSETAIRAAVADLVRERLIGEVVDSPVRAYTAGRLRPLGLIVEVRRT